MEYEVVQDSFSSILVLTIYMATIIVTNLSQQYVWLTYQHQSVLHSSTCVLK